MNAYQTRAYKQGLDWMNGVSKHNDVDDECTPDFSCCVPDLYEQDVAERRRIFTCECERHKWPKPPLND